jgi:hypothetical protein
VIACIHNHNDTHSGIAAGRSASTHQVLDVHCQTTSAALLALQEYPEPDNSKLYVDLQLIWLAAALRCPAKLACELGHQAMMAQLSEDPSYGSGVYIELACNAAGILQGLR